MAARQNKDNDISIVEAVETLSAIAELDFDAEIGVTQSHDLLIQDKAVSYRSVYWVHTGDRRETVKVVREVFRTVLAYLKNFYKLQHGKIDDASSLENVKNIMVLVGEAAQKLDRYTSLFKKHRIGKVSNLVEYKQLENFYKNKVAKKESGEKESILTDTIKNQELSTKEEEQSEQKATDIQRTWMDLDEVKRDLGYELMLLRKPGGDRFYSSKLLRNMKLVGDFGRTFGARSSEDPLLRTRFWLDRIQQLDAEYILRGVGGILDEYVDHTREETQTELMSLLNKAMMALFLAANPRNLLRNSPVKACHEYMADFQHYLRRALTCSEYRKRLTYPSKKSKVMESVMMDFCHGLCRSLFMKTRGGLEFQETLELLINQEARRKELNQLSEQPWLKYTEFVDELLRSVTDRHSNGPLLKTLELIGKAKKRRELGFDPMMQDNLPQHTLNLYMGKERVRLIHLPTPTAQIYIHRCDIIPEFKGLIQSMRRSHEKRKHLVINFQDRTSSRQHARCKALEEFAQKKECRRHLDVVTMPKDTDFYLQQGHYRDEDEALTFLEHLLEHIRSDNSGFYFPPALARLLLGGPIETLINGVHRLFFGKRGNLNRDERLTFVEIVYLLMQLKLLEGAHAQSLSLTCKDGMDIGAAASAQLFAFVQMLNNAKWKQTDIDHLHLLFFGPSLLLRERSIHKERYVRAFETLAWVEGVIQDKGYQAFAKEFKETFQTLFKTDLMRISAEAPPNAASSLGSK